MFGWGWWAMFVLSGALLFALGFYEGRSGGIVCSKSNASTQKLRSVAVELEVEVEVEEPCMADTMQGEEEEIDKDNGEKRQFPLKLKSKTLAQCNTFSSYGDMRLHKHLVKKSSRKEGNVNLNGILPVAFHQLHHPDTPSKAEYIVASAGTITSSFSEEQPYSSCDSVYLTRSGSRESMPNKCVAVAMVPSKEHSQTHSDHRKGVGKGDEEREEGEEGEEEEGGGEGEGPFHSPWFHSHRYGYQAKMRDQYVTDYVTKQDRRDEVELLPPVLRDLAILQEQVVKVLGPPLDEKTGERRTVVVMVANEGVMDLVLNFICSAAEGAADIDVTSLLVFLGQPEYIPLIESMGAKAVYHRSYGAIPEKAADGYGDRTFARLMWLKTTSVYVSLQAGFDVIFQDADLVWVNNPLPYLKKTVHDVAFMDDGARSTRFTPWFVNSGFYFMKRNPRTLYLMENMLKNGPGEISATHSHQATLTRYLTEVHHLAGLQVEVLPNLLFPSGAMYHQNKTYVKALIRHEVLPKVFHMCWTSSRTDKVKYFKELGLWFLPSGDTEGASTHPHLTMDPLQKQCEVPREMLTWVTRQGKGNGLKGGGTSIRDHCCQVGTYFSNKMKKNSKNSKK